MKVTIELVAQSVLREHASHSVFDDTDGVSAEELTGRLMTLTARIAGVVGVNLVGHLLAGETDFLGVDDDDIVTAIEMR